MKRLLRNKRTGEYFTWTGTWSKDLETAREFSNSLEALMAQDENWLIGVELLILMDHGPSEYDSGLPLENPVTERQNYGHPQLTDVPFVTGFNSMLSLPIEQSQA